MKPEELKTMVKKKVCQYLESLVSIVAANSWVAVLLLLLLDVFHTANTSGRQREEEEEEYVRKREAGRQAGREWERARRIYFWSLMKLPAHIPDNIFVESMKQSYEGAFVSYFIWDFKGLSVQSTQNPQLCNYAKEWKQSIWLKVSLGLFLQGLVVKIWLDFFILVKA